MKILIKPEDILKRCLWDNYVSWILLDDNDLAKELLNKNEEFSLKEEDALVIGLLRILETPNLIHKFNTYITDVLINKSVTSSGDSYIRKRSLEILMESFFNKFPEYWSPDLEWKGALNDLKEYYDEIKKEIDSLDIREITDKFGTHEFVKSNSVKKLLKFNYL